MKSMLSTSNSLDNLIYKCIRHRVHTVDPNRFSNADGYHLYGIPTFYSDLLVYVDPFLFDLHAHDTGRILRLYILNKETKTHLTVINMPFWYSSKYCFNEGTWLEGKWDAELGKVVNMLTRAVIDKELEIEAQDRERARKAQELEKMKIAEFEKLFV